jgi:N-acetylmuramoyl-L-alanine amidase
MRFPAKLACIISLCLVSACAQRGGDDMVVYKPSTPIPTPEPQSPPSPAVSEPAFAGTPIPPLANVSAEGKRCLAQAIYFEARGESLSGRMAVAAVVLNRVRHEKFPDTICGVVRQGGEDPSKGCQFAWWCDGRSDVPTEPRAWADSQRLAREMVAGLHPDLTDGALFFHHHSITPYWMHRLHQTAEIDQHYFYR